MVFQLKNFKGKIFFLLLFAMAGLLVAGAYFRISNDDEYILAEQSYHFANQGIVQSPMFQGLEQGWEVRQYHFHKFFIVSGALVVKAFGLDITSLRTISLLFAIVAFFFVWRYVRETKGWNENSFAIVALILLTSWAFFNFSFVYRPEIMVLAFGLIAFYLVNKGLSSNRWYIYLGAVFAGLSAFSHLNGLCVMLAGAFLLLCRKEFKAFFLFSIVSGSVALLYFFDLTSVQELHAFWQQFTHDPNLSAEDFQLFAPVIKIIDEQQRFFHDAKTASLTILFLTSLALFFKSLKRDHGNMLLFLLGLVLGLASVSHCKAVKYGLVYYPFIAFTIAYAFTHFNTLSRVKRIWLIATLALFVCANIYSIGKQLYDSYKWRDCSTEVQAYMPKKGVNVLANGSLFLTGYSNYTVHIPMGFEQMYDNYLKRKYTAADFFAFAEKCKDYYIVLDTDYNKDILEMLCFNGLVVGDRCGNYKVVARSADYVIFEFVK